VRTAYFIGVYYRLLDRYERGLEIGETRRFIRKTKKISCHASALVKGRIPEWGKDQRSGEAGFRSQKKKWSKYIYTSSLNQYKEERGKENTTMSEELNVEAGQEERGVISPRPKVISSLSLGHSTEEGIEENQK